MQGVKVLGVMGRIQVTNGWENDPMLVHGSWKWIEGRGMSGYPPRADIRWRAERAEQE